MPSLAPTYLLSSQGQPLAGIGQRPLGAVVARHGHHLVSHDFRPALRRPRDPEEPTPDAAYDDQLLPWPPRRGRRLGTEQRYRHRLQCVLRTRHEKVETSEGQTTGELPDLALFGQVTYNHYQVEHYRSLSFCAGQPGKGYRAPSAE